MSELRGFYTLWLREVKRFLRDRTRLVSSFVQPLLWLVIFLKKFQILLNILVAVKDRIVISRDHKIGISAACFELGKNILAGRN